MILAQGAERDRDNLHPFPDERVLSALLGSSHIIEEVLDLVFEDACRVLLVFEVPVVTVAVMDLFGYEGGVGLVEECQNGSHSFNLLLFFGVSFVCGFEG